MSFIICSQKRSRPKVSTNVCKKCRRMKKCIDYISYLQPRLFPDLGLGPYNRKRKPIRRKIEIKVNERQQKQNQLELGFK